MNCMQSLQGVKCTQCEYYATITGVKLTCNVTVPAKHQITRINKLELNFNWKWDYKQKNQNWKVTMQN